MRTIIRTLRHTGSDSRSRRARGDLDGALRRFVLLTQDHSLLGTFVYRGAEIAVSGPQIALLQNSRAAGHRDEKRAAAHRTSEAWSSRPATAEGLGVINSCPSISRPVFYAILRRRTLFCDAARGTLFSSWEDVPGRRGTRYPEELRSLRLGVRASEPRSLHRNSPALGLFTARSDTVDDPVARRRRPSVASAYQSAFVPLRKTALLVVISCTSAEVGRPFTTKQSRLLQNFAAAGIIAM